MSSRLGTATNGYSVTTVSDQETVHRVNVNFSGEAYNELVKLARRKGKSISDVLREAISLEIWVDQALRDGGRVLVERDGKVHELLRI